MFFDNGKLSDDLVEHALGLAVMVQFFFLSLK